MIVIRQRFFSEEEVKESLVKRSWGKTKDLAGKGAKYVADTWKSGKLGKGKVLGTGAVIAAVPVDATYLYKKRKNKRNSEEAE